MFVFKGTKDVEDLKADAQVFVSGLANSGRYKRDLADVNNNIMRLCTQNKPCTVTLTGHSLGGAIAMEVSRDLQNNPRVNLQGGDLFNSFYQPKDFDNEQLFTKHYIDVDPLHTGKPLGIDLRGAMGGRSGSEFKNRVVYTYPKDIDASKDVRFNQHYMTAF